MATGISEKAKARPAKAVPQRDVQPGMGAIPHEGGVAFRVWAPHADSGRSSPARSTTGTADRDPMTHEDERLLVRGRGRRAGSGTSTVTSSTTGRDGSPASTRTPGR